VDSLIRKYFFFRRSRVGRSGALLVNRRGRSEASVGRSAQLRPNRWEALMHNTYNKPFEKKSEHTIRSFLATNLCTFSWLAGVVRSALDRCSVGLSEQSDSSDARSLS
jgi:hypothetical protein